MQTLKRGHHQLRIILPDSWNTEIAWTEDTVNTQQRAFAFVAALGVKLETGRYTEGGEMECENKRINRKLG